MKKVSLDTILSLALLLSVAVHGYAQSFDFRCLSQANGLPAAGVYHLAEDSIGRLLIGTEGGGLARFDGERFTTWDHTNGLNADTIRCLLPLSNGDVWLGADHGGLWRLRNDSFKQVDSPLLNKAEIRSLAPSNEGDLFIATMEHGLFRFSEGEVRPVKELQNLNVRALLKTSDSTLFIGTDSGAYVKTLNGSFRRLTNATNGSPSDMILALFEDQQRRVWAGTESGPIILNKTHWSDFNAGKIIIERVRTITQDKQGDLWFGTQNGAFEYEERNNTVHHYTIESGLSNNRIRNIYRDRSGTLWFSTYFGGICQLTSQALVHFNREQGFPESPIHALTIGCDSSVWFGTLDGGLFRWLEGERPRRVFQTRSLNRNNMVAALSAPQSEGCHISEGRVHASTEFDGIFSFSLTGDQIPEATYSYNPGTWVTGTVFKLAYWDNKQVLVGTRALLIDRTIHTAQDLGVERFTDAFIQDSLLYLGTTKGIYSIHLTEVQRKEKPTLISGSKRFEISALAVDHTGQIWFGTPRDGLYRFTASGAKKQSSRYLTDPRILALSLDPDNDLWVATRKGVTHLELDPSQEIIIDQNTFGPEHGLTGQINPRTMAWDNAGHLWLGTSRGIFKLDPYGDFHNPTPPGLRILQMRLNYERVEWSTYKVDTVVYDLPVGLTLPHNQNHITFDFKAIDLSDPDRIVYQCKLEGFDPEWVDLGKLRSQTYPVLPPGDYTFLLRSRNSSGIWNEHPKQLSFSISPPFYASPWFIAGSTLLLILLIFLFIKMRLRSLEIRNIELAQQVAERTQEVTQEREKSDALLENILPEKTAQELKETGRAKARRYPEASVLFSDLKGFTSITEQLSPDALVEMLDNTFRAFDKYCDPLGVEKIKTMGDAYMCATGLPEASDDHAIRLVKFALAMLEEVEQLDERYRSKGLPGCRIRIGIHSGPVISGVVGKRKFAYDIWGDTVNIASRMESSGEVGHINISKATYDRIKDHFICEPRGKVAAKNKGEMEMYFVKAIKTP